MHVDRIPNRTSPPAFLLRETYREGGKVKKRTLANITHWPAGKISALRRLLRDEYAPDLKLMRSLPHGHVAAALGMLRKLGLDNLLAQGQRQRARMVALVTALVVVRLLDPASKLTTARLLDGTTATSSLGTVLALGMSTSRNSTTRSIGSSPSRSASKPRWPDAISAMARWCSTT